MPPETFLSIENLSAGYPGQEGLAIENIDWELKGGTLAGVVGPNGAGKSTLLKACMGLVPVQSGTARFFQNSIQNVRKRVAYMPQRSSVDWDFPVSVLDVAVMGLYSRLGWLKPVNKSARGKAMEALKKVGLEHLAGRQIGALSGGQQQRTFLARALAQDADIYLMDEPFAGVDAATENKIIEVLNDLKKAGKAIVVVHHDLGTARNIFDRVLLINREIVAEGPSAKVLSEKNIVKAYNAPPALAAKS